MVIVLVNAQITRARRPRHRTRVSCGGILSTQGLLVELLLSGFFAVACFRARATSFDSMKVTPRELFVLLLPEQSEPYQDGDQQDGDQQRRCVFL